MKILTLIIIFSSISFLLWIIINEKRSDKIFYKRLKRNIEEMNKERFSEYGDASHIDNDPVSHTHEEFYSKEEENAHVHDLEKK